jgi:hypothetical protein
MSHERIDLFSNEEHLDRSPPSRLHDIMQALHRNDTVDLERNLRVLQQLPPEILQQKIASLEEWALHLGIIEAQEIRKGKELKILTSESTSKTQ